MCAKRSNTVYIGDYQLTGQILGKGNYSVVREGIDKRGQKFALKIVDIETDDYTRKHYKREGYILSQLNYDCIIKMFEVIEKPKHIILVLEFIPDNLCDFVRNHKRGKLEECLARVLFRQIMSAVSFIHEKGIIHRDIKLENILIDQKCNKVKLTGNY